MKVEKQMSGRSADKPGIVPIPDAFVHLSLERIATMSEEELKILLPQLVAVLQQGMLPKRPNWWPHSALPWTLQNLTKAVKTASPSSVRNLVNKCYSFVAQHSIGPASAQTGVTAQPKVLDWLHNQAVGGPCISPTKTAAVSGTKQDGVPYVDIYLCCQCDTEFSTKDTLRKHQVQCCAMSLQLSIPSTPPVSEAPSPAPVTAASDDASFSDGVSACTMSCSSNDVSQSQFINSLDLVPIYRARKILQTPRRNTECDTLDLEDAVTPISPTTPRTPKLLISQLSREASSVGSMGSGGLGRRRLSCLRLSLEKRPDSMGKEEKEGDGEGESDGESAESNPEDADEARQQKRSLFNIDVSSSLGQRVLKHMTAETHLPVIFNAEEYCRTPIKDKYQGRLRMREPTYPVTWKLTHKRMLQQANYHVYKFTKAHKLEFMDKMRTGLSLQSRKLGESMRSCSVVIKRLSRKTFYKWNSSKRKISNPLQSLSASEISQLTQPKPKQVVPQPSVFPKGPTFLQIDLDRVLGLKRKDGSPEMARKLLASHCVSEMANAELQQQKLTVYRSLLTDLYSSVSPGNESVFEETPCKTSVHKRSPKKEQTYPTLLSILSRTASSSKSTFQNKNTSSVDVSVPLKIDIPSPESDVSLGVQKSPADNGISVTPGLSDADSSKSVCCPLCTLGKKCHCTPEYARTMKISPVPSSLTPKLSSLDQASPTPPKLDPLSLTPQVSVSSLSSLSPPKLSPASDGIKTSALSPGPSTRSSMRSCRLSPRPTYSSPRRSPIPSQSLGTECNEKSCSDTTPSSSRNDKMATDEMESKAISPSEKILGRRKQALHKPHTRFSSRQSAGSDVSGVDLVIKPTLRPSTSRGKDVKTGRDSLSTNKTDKIKSDLPANEESCLTPSFSESDSLVKKSAATVCGQVIAGSDNATVSLKNTVEQTDRSHVSDESQYRKEMKEQNSMDSPENSEKEDKTVVGKKMTEEKTDNIGRKWQNTGKIADKIDIAIDIANKDRIEADITDMCRNDHRKITNSGASGAGELTNIDAVDTASMTTLKKDVTEMGHTGVKRTGEVRNTGIEESSESRNTVKKAARNTKVKQTKVCDGVESVEAVHMRKMRTVESANINELNDQTLQINEEMVKALERNKEMVDVREARQKTGVKRELRNLKIQNYRNVGRMETSIALDRKIRGRNGKPGRRVKRLGGNRLSAPTNSNQSTQTSGIVRTATNHSIMTRSLGSSAVLSKGLPQNLKSFTTGVVRKNPSIKGSVSVRTPSAALSPVPIIRHTRSGAFVNGSETETSSLKKDERKEKLPAAECVSPPFKRKAAEILPQMEQNGASGVSASTNTVVNPFLISRAQTRLFSKNIKEHNRRHWKKSRQSPMSLTGSSRGLRSGNTFQMSNISLFSPTIRFNSEALSERSSVDHASQSINSPAVSLQENKSTDSQIPAFSLAASSAGVPPSNSRKGLSPMQMLSVLESAKGGGSLSKGRVVTGVKGASVKSTNSEIKLDNSFTKTTGKRPSYNTRARETCSPQKKGRVS